MEDAQTTDVDLLNLVEKIIEVPAFISFRKVNKKSNKENLISKMIRSDNV